MISRLESPRDLKALRAERGRPKQAETRVRVCSTGCRAMGAPAVCDALEREIAGRGLADRARVVRTGCHGLCSGAVSVIVDPRGILYQGVQPEDAAEIVATTVESGKVVDRLCPSADGKPVRRQRDLPFFRGQLRRVLAGCGKVDPRDIGDSIAHGGYAALAKVLSGMSPEAVIDEVAASGLRGRGGAGFPTGPKWQFARAASEEPKYIICNADEGDPGAFMDRALLEGDPHLVLEGMIIGAYAIGASKGFIYVRAEYPLAVEQMKLAVVQAREAGLLGQNILGSGFALDLEVFVGAGSYVCGEETALIASLDGRRGMPRPRPPFPAHHGLRDKPTNVNNVETLANIPRVIEQGAKEYAKVGTPGSKGTKIFSLSGQVNHTGLVEVPMGTTLRRLIFDIGGGMPAGRRFKAAHIGGPCGGFVPEAYLDVPVDEGSLKEAGAMLGCGGVIVLSQDVCMVDMAVHIARFAVEESCGQCVPCRIGTRRILEILTRVWKGAGRPEDLDRLEELCRLIDQTSFCGMAPNPVGSTLRYFRGDYEAHLEGKGPCPHGCVDGKQPSGVRDG